MASGAAKNKTLVQGRYLRKYDVQSVDNGDRWCIEIGLCQCDNRQSWNPYR